jgi:flagellar protein FliO/FliZ
MTSKKYFLPIALLCLSLSFFSSASATEANSVQPSTGLLQIFMGLIAVLALMAVAAWLLKKIGPVTNGSIVPVKVVGGVSLGNRERVMVIEVAGQWIVVGVTASNINTLTTLQKPENSDQLIPGALPENQFSIWLKRTIDKRNQVR